MKSYWTAAASFDFRVIQRLLISFGLLQPRQIETGVHKKSSHLKIPSLQVVVGWTIKLRQGALAEFDP